MRREEDIFIYRKITLFLVVVSLSLLLFLQFKEKNVDIVILDDFNKNIKTNACSYYNSKKHGFLVFNTIKSNIPKNKCRNVTISLIDVVENGDIDEKLVSKELIKAANEKKDIVNMSFGSINNNKHINSSVKSIYRKKLNLYIVSSAGNNFGMQSLYPAILKNVISIGALNNKNEISDVSAQKYVNYYVSGVYQDEVSTSIAAANFTGFLAKEMINDNCHDLKLCIQSKNIKKGDKNYEN